MNKLLSLLLFACCLSNPATAQQTKPNYSLLWEISGQDFHEKSYLFGTMHLRDERVYELCDSVMLSIEACKAFAVEIHPDSVLSYMIDREMQGDTSDLIGALMDSLGRKFDLVNGDFLWDSVMFKQPDFIKNILTGGIKEGAATKKRPQILDYTLFGYAKDREKSLFGLERLQDYRDMAQAFFQQNQSDKKNSMLIEGLVEVYRKGDLDTLKAMFDRLLMDEKLRAEMLSNRNIRMVARMKTLGARQSTFFAMGAAHLPFNDGVIALLRKEGYTVRKVKGTFTGVADSLFLANKPRDLGIVFTDPKAGYSMTVPSKPFIKPISITSEDGYIISGITNSVLDLRRGYEFSTATMDYPTPLVFHDKRELFKTLDEEYISIFGPHIGEPEDVKIDGYTGRQMKYRMGSNIVDLQVIMRGNRFYAFSTTRQSLSADAPCRQFFKSIKILPLAFSPLYPTTILETGSKIAFPGKYASEFDTSFLSYSKYPNDNTGTFCAMDTLSTTQYLLVEDNWSKYFTVTDSFFSEFKKALVDHEFEVVRDTLFRSMPAYLLSVNDMAGQYFAEHLIIFTDDGSCELIVINPEPGQEERNWAFFNSFETTRKWTGIRKTDVYKKRIFTDLLSPDSLTTSNAKYALTRTTLGIEDLPDVLNILNTRIPEDTLLWGSIHQRLWASIEELKDARIIPFAETYFKANRDRSDRQEYALKALLTQHNPTADEVFFRLAPEVDSLESNGDFSFSDLHNYFDSTFASACLPRLIGLREHPSFNYVIISAIEDLFKETPGIRPIFAPYGADLVKDAWKLVQQYNLLSFKDTLPFFDGYWTLLNYIDLLGYFPETTGSVAFLKKLTGIPDATICGAVTNSLFRLGQKADVNVLQKWHKNPAQWYQLLSSLQDAYLDKLPAKLLDAETFIEGAIPALIYEEDYVEVKDFKVIEKRKYTYQEQKLWLYLFTYRSDFEEDPDSSYLGVYGVPEKGRITLNPSIFNTSYETYNVKNKEALVEQLLKEE